MKFFRKTLVINTYAMTKKYHGTILFSWRGFAIRAFPVL
jgi:hypothetical protein